MQNNRRFTNASPLGTIVLAALVILLTSVAFAAGAQPGQTSTTNDKTFFYQFIIAGGTIVWFVLLPMSVAMLCLAIDLCFSIRRKKLLPPDIGTEIASAAQRIVPSQIPVRLSENNDLVSRTLVRTFNKCRHIEPDSKHVQHIAAESLQEQALVLLRKVEWCNIIGNVAPMVGLFGTVFGMIQAFDVLDISGGQPQHGQLAAKISIALVTTFWGLLIAIPALAIHGIFRTRIEGLVSEAAIEVENLIFQIPLPKKTPQTDLAKKTEDARTNNQIKRSPPTRRMAPDPTDEHSTQPDSQ
jgi:biopolymer transport protein ExbB